MIQKYSAYHTLALLVLGVILAITGIGKGTSITMDDFETPYGKAIFGVLLLYAILPPLINVFSMLWDMLKNGRWAYFFGTFFLAYLITVIYYFRVYRKR